MPDWTYRTVIQPVLDALPAGKGMDLAIRGLALLVRLPFGTRVLEFFGHMRPDRRLAVEVAGRCWVSPVGLGCRLDPDGRAIGAWARFGFGFAEIGPLRPDHLEFPFAKPLSARTASNFAEIFPVWVRLAQGMSDRVLARMRELRPDVVGFVVELDPTLTRAEGASSLAVFVDAVRRGNSAVKICVSARWGLDWYHRADLVALGELVRECGVDGLWLGGGKDASGSGATIDPEAGDFRWTGVSALREKFGREFLLVVGDVPSPREALALCLAGVDLMAVDHALMSSGPGLPKRIHAVLLAALARGNVSSLRSGEAPWARQSWFWCALLGASMLAGGLMAMWIAATRVVLPYDEVFCGTTRDGLAAINDRLLSFMAHDRVTLAGTMISIGGLYLGLALGGVRRGFHWAKATVVSSACAGFLSFFLFLGYGYFDPFHAFVSSVLFQFLLLAMYAQEGEPDVDLSPDLDDTVAWRRGQWGQLLFVGLGVGLVGAGMVISGIGITHVFVQEDLEYLRTTVASLNQANARLVPLVAHDRASVGGMLIANGLAVWLTAQWGFVGGARWLWWTLLLSGSPAFAAAIGIHFAVGYTDLFHLAPAMLAAVVFVVAMVLTREWLCEPEKIRRKRWEAVAGTNAGGDNSRDMRVNDCCDAGNL